MGTKKRKKWEYMSLCPDSDAGFAEMFRVGEDGWEAVCAWVEVVRYPLDSPDRNVTHILYKRPV